MGEAKRRGTFEERKAAALKRDAAAWKERKLAEIDRRRNMTHKERIKERKATEFLAVLYGVAGASVLNHNNPLNTNRAKSG